MIDLETVDLGTLELTMETSKGSMTFGFMIYDEQSGRGWHRKEQAFT